MNDKKVELDEKRAQLEELIKSRSKATCTYMNSSMDAVARETRIEELEDEIKELEQELSEKK